MKFVTSLLLALTLTACSQTPQVDAAAPFWGEALAEAETVALADLLADPAAYDNKPVTVVGDVTSVCQKKGCWMVLTAGDETMRVTFKDYGFFVPMELDGAVLVQGVFSVKTVSEADARHYLEDEGKPEEAKLIVGEQQEFSLEATGVQRAD